MTVTNAASLPRFAHPQCRKEGEIPMDVLVNAGADAEAMEAEDSEEDQ